MSFNQSIRHLAPSSPIRLLPILLAIALTTATLSAASLKGTGPSQEKQAKADDPERQKKLEERRAQRQERLNEMREKRNDPGFIKENAWWNAEKNVEALKLTTAQRKSADQAMDRFLKGREARQDKSREAQKAFFEALETGAADVAKKRDAMVQAMSDSHYANADLRIAVMSELSKDQKKKIGEDMPRILRGNWADVRPQRSSMMQRRQRPGQNRP